MNRSIKILFLFLFSSQALFAQLAQVPPETEGFSASRLEKITGMLHSYTDNHQVAGVVALVARNGKIVYYQAEGYNNMATGRLMKKDDIFRIASQTKAVTGVAVMMLYEEGKFLLDDPISKYIPEFKGLKVLKSFNSADSSYTTEPAKRGVTIRDLLTHTSGISYPVIGTKEADAIYGKADVPTGFEARHITLAEGMKRLSKLPLMHQPGEAWTYGLNIDLLGYLVELESGMSLKDFFHKRIFEPLGMKDTYFYLPPDKRSRLAQVYMDKDGKTVENDAKDSTGACSFYPKVNGTYYSGGAGLSSTAYDYSVFLQMLENGGEYNGHRLLSPSSVKMMTSNQVGDHMKGWNPDEGFGLTFGLVAKDGGVKLPSNPGTFYWGGYWGSSYWVDPKAGIVAQIWTQEPTAATGQMSEKFRVMVYSALEKATNEK